MKSRIWKTWPAAAGIIALACGASVIPIATDADLARASAGSTVESLNLGRGLYVRKCSGCHRLYAPSERSREEWPDEVEGMSGRVRLDASERELLIGYLVTMSGEDQ